VTAHGVSAGGFPYLLVDRMLECEAGVRALASKLVSANEPYFVGHFPGVPVVPGVILCEALAQVGRVVAGGDEALQLATVERARFRRPVQPGDALVLEVRARQDGPPWRMRGVVRDGETVVAEVEFALGVRPGPWIHPTAAVAPGAELADGVRIGAYAVIGPHVRIGRDSIVGPHTVVTGRTTLGERNHIYQFASVGEEPQDLKYKGEQSRLTIGDDNLIREYVSVNPGTEGGGMETRIGSHCLLMVSSHVAHDCRLGDWVILANGVALGGHVQIDDFATVGGLAGVHQFSRVGESALCAAGAMVSQDVPPFCIVAGDRARLYGLNVVGLQRRGLPQEAVRAIKRAYRLLFQAKEPWEVAVARTRTELGDVAEVARLLAFIEASQRGICR
jgi:UDP-N-acetylglucosamine acyltransferase